MQQLQAMSMVQEQEQGLKVLGCPASTEVPQILGQYELWMQVNMTITDEKL